MKKNIAIIGGGGAGATAAWALNKIHNVSLFEAEQSLGGHAFTKTIKVEGHKIPVDLGVEFFSEKQAPNLSALLSHFRIDTYVAPLSFAAIYDTEEEYWSNHNDNGNLWKKIREECSRFHLDMHNVIHLNPSQVKTITLGDFLKRQNYSDDFIFKALLPLMTTFSSCESPLLDYSLTFCAISFNMGLLSFFHPSYWRKAKGGIGSYITAIEKELGNKVLVNSRVEKVTRNKNNKVNVEFKGINGKECKEFDEVIFATHADIALSLIENPSPLEKILLSGFEYTKVQSVLHRDGSVLAPNLPYRCYCEFNGVNRKINQKLNGSLTRVINRLSCYQNIKTPILVTFDAKMPISEELVYLKKDWKIPKLRPVDMANKKKITKIQGLDRFWFCGTDTSFTGHEGAILSGLVIAEALGAKYPFYNNDWAKIQFDVVKGIMGIYQFNEKINNLFANSIYAVAKKLGLHKGQVSRVLLDIYI